MAGVPVNPERRIDVLGIGVTSVDDLVYVEEYPEPDTKTPILRRDRQGGGLAATALVAAARLGASCAYAGVLGDGELSRYVLDNFRAEGVDTSALVHRASAGPVHSIIVVDVSAQTRTILLNRRDFASPDDHLPPPELIQRARVLLVDHYGVTGTIRAARTAREAGVAVVADLEERPAERFEELLDLVDHLIVSSPFARELTGETDPRAAAEALWSDAREVACVTAGTDGSWTVDRSCAGAARHQPAYAVDVVDTTGCGDVFHGAYAAALAWGATVVERMAFASATAALKATRPGGQAGIPDRPSVETFLSEQSP